MQNFHVAGDYAYGKITYVWRCASCSELACDSHHFTEGSEVWRPPALPPGWKKINGVVYCPKHRIVITVDEAVSDGS